MEIIRTNDRVEYSVVIRLSNSVCRAEAPEDNIEVESQFTERQVLLIIANRMPRILME
jgi:hypothetical protein